MAAKKTDHSAVESPREACFRKSRARELTTLTHWAIRFDVRGRGALNMKRTNAAPTKRRLLRVIKLLDRKIVEMIAEAAARPDPARRLRPEERN